MPKFGRFFVERCCPGWSLRLWVASFEKAWGAVAVFTERVSSMGSRSVVSIGESSVRVEKSCSNHAVELTPASTPCRSAFVAVAGAAHRKR